MIGVQGFESIYTFVKSIENLPFDKQEEFLKSQKADEGDVVVVRKGNGGFELSVIEKAQTPDETIEKGPPNVSAKVAGGRATQVSYGTKPEVRWAHPKNVGEKRYSHNIKEGTVTVKTGEKKDKEKGKPKSFKAERTIGVGEEKELKNASLIVAVNQLLEKAKSRSAMGQYDEKVVQALKRKKNIDNPFALATWIKQHKKSVESDSDLNKAVSEYYNLEKAVERRSTSGEKGFKRDKPWSRGPGRDYVSEKDKEVTGVNRTGAIKQIRDKKTGAVGTEYEYAPSARQRTRQSILDKEGKITESFHRTSPRGGGPVVDVRRDISDIKPTSRLRHTEYDKSFIDEVSDFNKAFDEYYNL